MPVETLQVNLAATVSSQDTWIVMASVAQRRPTMPFVVPESQLYYWDSDWQQAEQAADADLLAGRTRDFSDVRDAIRWLLSDDD